MEGGITSQHPPWSLFNPKASRVGGVRMLSRLQHLRFGSEGNSNTIQDHRTTERWELEGNTIQLQPFPQPHPSFEHFQGWGTTTSLGTSNTPGHERTHLFPTIPTCTLAPCGQQQGPHVPLYTSSENFKLSPCLIFLTSRSMVKASISKCAWYRIVPAGVS